MKQMSNEEVSVSDCSRRNFLKWGILGVLVVAPFGVMLWKRWKKSQRSYSYALNGPFLLPDDKDVVGWDDSGLWSGNRQNNLYTPKVYGLHRRGTSDNPTVMFDIVFSVAEDAPVNLLALVKITLYSGGEVYTIKETEWGAPHKQPPKQTITVAPNQTPQWYTKPPIEYTLIEIPLLDLEKIDRITVDIEEIIRN